MLFDDFARSLRQLESTASRLEMTRELSVLFEKASAKEIGPMTYLLLGRVAPLFEAIEFGIADALMIRAIAQAYGRTEDAVRHTFRSTGDLGAAAEELYGKGLFHDESFQMTVTEAYWRLRKLAEESGSGSQERKIALLAELMSLVTPGSARYIARIPLDKLRLGFSDMTILDSLSWMLTGDKSLRSKLEDVYNVRPDIGFIASEIKKSGLPALSRVKATIGVPILPALCQRLPTADEMAEKMGTVSVEPKYDGVRVQIHVVKSKVKSQKSKVISFSRNLENTTAMFPELNEAAGQISAESAILDAEAVGLDTQTGKLIPFQETMTRKRKHGITEAKISVPLVFYVFDILYRNGQDLLSQPLENRYRILEETVKPGLVLKLTPHILAADAGAIRAYHDEQLRNGLEGAVVKKWKGPYEPGRRGHNWVKFKEEEGKTGKLTDTIDAVVMGYYSGEGKRTGLGIGALLVGVRSGDEFVTITKIGTGVSDELWKILKKRLAQLKIGNKPLAYQEVPKMLTPDFWVEPAMVVEIAGDDLTRSSNHGAGYAVRFPRLVKIREDKNPGEATTVAEIKTMYHNQAKPNAKK